MTPEEFYKNNVIEMVVPFSAGGGTDRAARTLTAYWSDFFGGTIKVNNMPGGGTVKASNFVWKAKPDGKTLYVTTFGTALASPTLYGAPGKEFDAAKFSYIMFYADEPPTFGIKTDLPYNSLEELTKAKGLKLGTTAPVGMPAFGNVTMLHVLGLDDAAVITGFDSTPEVGLAVKRGEVDGLVFSANSMKLEASKGIVKNLCTVTTDKTSPLLPGVEPVGKLLTLNAEQTRVLKTYEAAFKTGRVFLGPPGMDPAMVEYLRAKTKEMVASKGYTRLANKIFGFWDPPVMGADAAAIVKMVTEMPKADVDLMDSLQKKYVK